LRAPGQAARVDQIFDANRPDVVLGAAALGHAGGGYGYCAR
jgi:hypothetical protein